MSNVTTAVAIGLALLGSGLGVASYTKSQKLEQALAARTRAEPAEGKDGKDDGSSRLEDRVRSLERQVARLSFGSGPSAAAPTPTRVAAGAPAAADDGKPAGEPDKKEQRAAKALEPENLEKRLTKIKGVIRERWDKWGEQNGVSEKTRGDLVKVLEDAAAKREEIRLKRRSHDLDVATAREENRKVIDDVRGRARELLNEEQFKQFQSERGASAGTSWKDARRALRGTAPAKGGAGKGGAAPEAPAAEP